MHAAADRLKYASLGLRVSNTLWAPCCLLLCLCPQSLLVTTDVVPVTLGVSDEELMFTFGLDNWDEHVEQVRGSYMPDWERQRGLVHKQQP
jgi:hypothetical protein